MAQGADARLFVGLMSGTSMDAIDAALVELGDRRVRLLATLSRPYDPDLKLALHEASRHPETCGADDLGRLDHRVGAAFRDTVLELLESCSVPAADVTAIGSHGQTLRHLPRDRHPFTLQIGDPNLIAAGTGIPTVADFRRRDLALGGEAAPLAPGFHRWLFGDPTRHRVLLNLGGFANVTILPAGDRAVTGFDTGPANSLMDAWSARIRNEPFDEDGRWAASGTPDAALLEQMLADPFFSERPPKSTGFEHFDMGWLDRQLEASPVASPADVQATLCELTVRSIGDAIRQHAAGTDEVLFCGGGARNTYLVSRLRERLDPARVDSTAGFGADPAWIEALAFAWLAARRIDGLPGNLPGVTGASAPAVLGALYAGAL